MSFEDVRIGETVHGITRCVCYLRVIPLNLSNTQFSIIDFLYCRIINERLKQISLKLAEIQSGEAPEYLQPLAELEDNMRIRLEVAGVLRKFRLKNLDNQYEAEELTAKQNFEVFNGNRIRFFDCREKRSSEQFQITPDYTKLHRTSPTYTVRELE